MLGKVVEMERSLSCQTLFNSEDHHCKEILNKETDMDALAAMSFIFGMVGVVAFVRLQKLTKTLKEKGLLEEDYKEE